MTTAEEKVSAAEEFRTKLEFYIRSGFSCLWVQTQEESRALRVIKETCKKLSCSVYFWDCLGELYTEDSNKQKIVKEQKVPPHEVFPKFAQKTYTDRDVLCVMDYNFYVEQPNVIRNIRNQIPILHHAGKVVIFVGPRLPIPPDLEKDITFMEMPLPTREDLDKIFSLVVNSAKDASPKPIEFTNGLREGIINSSIGMTSQEAEDSYSLAVVRSTKQANVNPVQLVLDQKCHLLKRQGVLEYLAVNENMESVGGLLALKDWLVKRKDAFSERARKFGVPSPKGLLLVGVPGCLSGDTELIALRGDRKGGRRYRLEDIYYKLHCIPRDEWRSGSQYLWEEKMPTYVPAWLDGRVGYHEIDDVVFSGISETFEITTDSGKKLRATKNHPIFSPNANGDGYIPVEYLKVGDEVFCRQMEMKKDGKEQRKRAEKLVKYHPYASVKVVNGYEYKRIRLSYLVVEADMNNLPLDEYIHILNTDQSACQELQFLKPGVVVHHKDGNQLNDSIENLDVLESIQEHNRQHPNASVNFGNQNLVKETIVSISKFGEEPVYDIRMKDPYRNFIGNDFVVHNCGKSLVAKAVASYWEVPLLRLDMGRIFQSLVGKSEETVRTAIRLAETHAPCVTGDTKIMLGDGLLVSAKELYEKSRPGERLVSVDDKNSYHSFTVPLVGVIKREPKDVYLLKTCVNEIKQTENHQYLTRDGWKTVKELKKGDWLFFPHIFPRVRTESVPVGNLMPDNVRREGNQWTFGRGGWTDSSLSVLSEFITPEFGEFLGYVDSDGFCGQRRISFYNSDEVLLDRFEFLADKLFGIKPKRIPNSVPGYESIKSDGETITTRKHNFVSYIDCSLLVKFLTNLRNNLLRFDFYNLLPFYMRSFIAGDGCVESNQCRITITQVDIELRSLVQDVLRRLGVFGKFRNKNLCLSGEMARRLLEALKGVFSLPDKVEKAFFNPKKYHHKNGRAVRIAENGVYAKLESVEFFGKEEVYDPSCYGFHNYVSEGCISHNCILWIDEAEKGLAGAKVSGELDSGVTARVVGTILTWMQEKTSSVFVAATANDVSKIPPELLRKGRFDEIFFVDLPNEEERAEIIRIQLKKRSRTVKDIQPIIEASLNFTGAEIEQAVVSALYDCFFEKERDLTTDDICKTLTRMIPLSRTMEKDIDFLRTWGSTNARNASGALTAIPVSPGLMRRKVRTD